MSRSSAVEHQVTHLEVGGSNPPATPLGYSSSGLRRLLLSKKRVECSNPTYPIMIKCIGITVIDWKSFLADGQKVMGHSISGAIDKYKMKQDLAAFITTLYNLDFECDPHTAIRIAGHLLRHASATFMCALPTGLLNQFREQTSLTITSVEANEVFRLAIVSGDLWQWKATVIECCSENQTTELRALCNQFMTYFESSGLNLWTEMSRTPMKDKTLRLT